jgi:6,7-dimethyl-8-ribityllumazine synthase
MSIAAAQRDKGAAQDIPIIESVMTKEQIAQAKELARTFKPHITATPSTSESGADVGMRKD